MPEEDFHVLVIKGKSDPFQMTPIINAIIVGAPERILSRCSSYTSEDGTVSIWLCIEPFRILDIQAVPVTENFKDLFEKAYKDLGGLGERVLG